MTNPRATRSRRPAGSILRPPPGRAILVDAVVGQTVESLSGTAALDDLAQLLWLSEHERQDLVKTTPQKPSEPNEASQFDQRFAWWE